MLNCRMAGVLLVLLFHAFSGKAQFTGKPSPFLDTVPKEVRALMDARLAAENAAITTDKPKIRSFIKTVHKERLDYIVKLFNDDLFLGDSELSRHTSAVFENIVQSNPKIPQDASLYLYRSNSPNALSFGQGTLAFSLALLSRLENDAQVAFILSHELAHYYLGHTRTAIEKYASLNFDKDINKEVKTISRSQYERYSRMKELMKNLELSFNRHSRSHELEADSIGLLFFLNSRYADAVAPVRTMELLDSADAPIFKSRLELKKRFDFKEHPFKDSWLTYRKSTTWYARKEMSDTSQTHPSCLVRAGLLNDQIARQSSTAHFEGQDFSSVKLQAQLDLVEANYHFKLYGKALYLTLQMLEALPDNAYLHAMIGKCFYQLYISQKNHELGKVLELPDPRFPENYDRFLTFVHTLRIGDLEKIAYYYIISQDEKFFENEEFLHAVWLCSQLPVSRLSTTSVEEDYKRLFPQGKYIRQMN